jgi:hypothetical protein
MEGRFAKKIFIQTNTTNQDNNTAYICIVMTCCRDKTIKPSTRRGSNPRSSVLEADAMTCSETFSCAINSGWPDRASFSPIGPLFTRDSFLKLHNFWATFFLGKSFDYFDKKMG